MNPLLNEIYQDASTTQAKCEAEQFQFLHHKIALLTETMASLVLECEYSAKSGVPFNFPNNQTNWTQLAKAKALLKPNFSDRSAPRKIAS